MKKILSAVLFLIACVPAFTVDGIKIDYYYYDGENADYEAEANRAIEHLPEAIEQYYSDEIRMVEDNPTYLLEIFISYYSPEDVRYVLNLQGDANYEPLTRTFTLHDNLDILGVLTPTIYSTWLEAQGFENPEGAVTFIESFDSDGISTDYAYQNSIGVIPYDIDILPSGNLVLTAASLLAEITQDFQLVDSIGEEISTNDTSFAYKTEVTPSGAMHIMGFMGGDMYTFYPGSTKPVKTNLGFSSAPIMSTFRDGTIMAYDLYQQKIFKIERRKKTEIDYKSFGVTYTTYATTTKADEYWILDAYNQRIVILNKNGDFLRYFYLAIPTSLSGSIKKFIVNDDGSFYALTHTDLFKLSKNGRLEWLINSDVMPNINGFTTVMEMTVDHRNKTIFLVDVTAKKIIKLKETQEVALSDSEKKLVELNNAITQDPNNPDNYIYLGEYYESIKRYASAENNYNEAYSLDPFNFEMEEKIKETKVHGMSRRAQLLYEATLRDLQLGPESARLRYMSAIQLYEKILSIDPYNTHAKMQSEDLKRRFAEAEQLPGRNNRPLQFAQIKIDSIFPSLLYHYNENPIGYVTIKNPHDITIENIEVGVSLRHYTDFVRTGTPVERLGPGAEIQVPLFVSLNTEVFNVEEDMPVQAQITLNYTAENKSLQQSKGKSVLLHRKSALTWDDTAKLASFITPNEAEVSDLSHHLSRSGDRNSSIPDRLSRAVSIFEGLRTFDISYIEDPSTPITQVFDSKQVVDTVRFARKTLQYRSGDCDDTTVLLTSLFEASGLDTAIMTSPGHVFLAFSTGDSKSNRWLYETENLKIIIHENKVWIPIESTIINKGFTEAWKYASDLCQRYADELEFVPVNSVRDKYPPLPIPAVEMNIQYPLESLVLETSTKEDTYLTYELFDAKKAELEALMATVDGRKALRIQNRIGQLLARFNRTGEALALYQKIIDDNPRYPTAYINLANIHIMNSNYGAAMNILESGAINNPEAPFIKILLAKVHYINGDKNTADEIYIDLSESSPDLVKAYPLEGSISGRAGTDNIQPLWISDEE